MAAAAAAVGSSFSTSVQTLKCLRSKGIASTRILFQTGLASHIHAIDAFSVGPISQKWRIPRIFAATAQEEAAAPAAEGVEEVSGGGEADGVVTGSTVNTKLYLGNLPYHCDSAQLAGLIQQYASPELVEVLYDRETGRSRGFAFVTMSSIEDCNVVIENLDGSEYGGRTLRVNFSDKPRPREPLYPETDYKLFVGNLAWSVTSESLTEAFQEYGNVVGARVLYDGETGRSRGYGFVCYSTKSEMDTALESLNGVELEGRAMRISVAQGKRQ
ncbi:hypothetical protein NMG60_11017548 [Bertholletia excelsa]